MTRTAVAAADAGGGAVTTVMWHIEELLTMLHHPFWAVAEMRHDEDAALARLEFLRSKNPNRKWRIKVVTMITVEKVLDV